MQEEGSFSSQQFFLELAIHQAEQAEVEDCLVRGLEFYYRYVYGYDKYGEYPEFLVQERMYEPFIFGFGAVEVVRRSNLSIETRQKVVQYTWRQIRPMEEYGIPYGLPVLLSFLARTEVLEAPLFRSILLMAAVERHHLFDELHKDELLSLLDWMTAQANLPPGEQLWWVQFLSSYCDKPHLGKPMMEHLLLHPRLATTCKRDLCRAWLSKEPRGKPPAQWIALKAKLQGDSKGFKAAWAQLTLSEQELMPSEVEDKSALVPDLSTFSILVDRNSYLALIPNYMKRRAVLGLAQLGEDPISVCQTYLDSESGSAADAINQGVVDVIREYRQDLPQAVVQKLVERGLKIRKTNTRKTFFQLGAELLGPEYLTRSQSEPSKSIRDWAAQQAVSAPLGKHERATKR